MSRKVEQNAAALKRGPKASANTAEQSCALLDLMKNTFGLKNDAALSRFLHVTPPQICKMRQGVLSYSPEMIIRTHEVTGWAIADIKKKLGLPSIA